MKPSRLKFKGRFKFQLVRKGTVVKEFFADNGVTDEGKNDILDVYFNDGTKTTTWYLGLISGAGFSELNSEDTMDNHAGWTEFTGYNEPTRPEWAHDGPDGQAVVNSTPVQFNITATGTIKGGFAVADDTKTGTTGPLWATALFENELDVENGDVLNVTYSVTAG